MTDRLAFLTRRAPASNGRLPHSFAALRASQRAAARAQRRRLNRPTLYDHGGVL
jgi:hypothetical protein